MKKPGLCLALIFCMLMISSLCRGETSKEEDKKIVHLSPDLAEWASHVNFGFQLGLYNDSSVAGFDISVGIARILYLDVCYDFAFNDRYSEHYEFFKVTNKHNFTENSKIFFRWAFGLVQRRYRHAYGDKEFNDYSFGYSLGLEYFSIYKASLTIESGFIIDWFTTDKNEDEMDLYLKLGHRTYF